MKKAILPSLILVFAAGLSFLLPLEKMGNFFFASAITPVQISTNVPQTIADTGMLEEGQKEFFLVADRSGKKSYTIDQNTCANGVRIVVRGREEIRSTSNMDISLHIFGFSRQKSKQVYSSVLELTEEEPVKVLHLPSATLHLNETLFPEYKINPSKNSDFIRYDVMCY